MNHERQIDAFCRLVARLIRRLLTTPHSIPAEGHPSDRVGLEIK